MGTTKVTQTELQAEYERAVKEALSLAKEYDQCAPDHLKQRIRKAIKYAANQLIMMEVPKHKVVGKLYEDFEGFYTDRHIRNILQEDGTLPAEDGGENGNNSENNGSLNTPTQWEKENTDEIALLDATIAFLKDTVRKKLTEGPYVSKILLSTEILQAKMDLQTAKATGDKISVQAAEKRLDDLMIEQERRKRILDEQRFTRRAMLKTGEECWDGRQSVPVVYQHMLMLCIEQYNVAGGAETYQSMVKDVTLVPKQATKYRHGEVRELLPLYDPKNQEEAILSGFYGKQCPMKICDKCGKSMPQGAAKCDNVTRKKENTHHVIEIPCGGTTFHDCKSWRVKLDKDATAIFKLHCYNCLGIFIPQTIKLPSNGIVLEESKVC